jgi:hypothetical protein
MGGGMIPPNRNTRQTFCQWRKQWHCGQRGAINAVKPWTGSQRAAYSTIARLGWIAVGLYSIGGKKMGEFVGHRHIPHVRQRMNFRFAHGDALKEMVACQKHFEVFSHKHPLSRSFALVDAAPEDEKQRRGFFRYVDRMTEVGSNVKGHNGHAAIVAALKKNLESKSPLPVHFTYHLDPRGSQKVRISTSKPHVYSKVKYLTISFPTLHEK